MGLITIAKEKKNKISHKDQKESFLNVQTVSDRLIKSLGKK
jgi:hypothetical protein